MQSWAMDRRFLLVVQNILQPSRLEYAKSVLENLSGGSLEIVDPEKIHTREVDVFCPCARGGIINEKTIPELNCAAVVGSANNQLLTPKDGDRLHNRGILFGVDFIVNALGLKTVAGAFEPNFSRQRIKIEGLPVIRNTLELIFNNSAQANIAPHRVANALAQQKLDAITNVV